MSARAAGRPRPVTGWLRRGRARARAWLAGIPAAEQAQTGEPGPGDGTGPPGLRPLIVLAFIGSFMLSPAVTALTGTGSPARRWFLFGGTLLFLAGAVWVVFARPGARSRPWALLVPLMALAIVLNAIGGLNWITALAVAAAGFGRFAGSAGPARAGAALGVAGGLLTVALRHASYGSALAAVALPPMAAYFSYSAGRRNEMVAALRRNRAELAQLAVARERLRIARDLHDLLGHSLSLITLKAELAGRLIETDPGRAAREVSELETVARQSLTDVRQAVASYRRPDLAAELAAARQLLTTAGIGCQINVPARLELAPDADALLAWTVREGATNVVRHAAAGQAVITVTTGPDRCAAEVADDGAGAAEPAAAGTAGGPGRPPGSGLAGLGERARELGGVLTAGPAVPHGFRLAVSLPAGPRPDHGRGRADDGAGNAP